MTTARRAAVFMMKLPAKVGVLVLDLLAAVLVLYSVSLIFLSNFNMGNLMVWLLTACVAGYAVFRRPLSLWFFPRAQDGSFSGFWPFCPGCIWR